MQYFGGKSRVAKDLAEVINGRLLSKQTYVEPFCGAMNIACRITGSRNMLLNDGHPHLYHLWEWAMKDMSIFPNSVTEEDYQRIHLRVVSNDDSRAMAIKGFVGFGCSFGGKWFGGYARDARGGGNFAQTAINGLAKKVKRFEEGGGTVTLANSLYDQLFDNHIIPAGTLIYCDPPYRGTTGYKGLDAFDSDRFNAWAEDLCHEGHDVIISEYLDSVPKGAEVIWERESSRAIRGRNGSLPTTECLYTFPVS